MESQDGPVVHYQEQITDDVSNVEERERQAAELTELERYETLESSGVTGLKYILCEFFITETFLTYTKSRETWQT